MHHLDSFDIHPHCDLKTHLALHPSDRESAQERSYAMAHGGIRILHFMIWEVGLRNTRLQVKS
jgi:hypothetical protein